MRKAHDHHAREFDVVLSADNSVPHLPTDEHILAAFGQFFLCTRPGGGCIVTVRDYEKEDLSKQQVKPYGILQTELRPIPQDIEKALSMKVEIAPIRSR